ncbi:hypothetical protein HPB48_002983 [Haemaphysalis longicornis]|uniref:Uncharacterized protein n=1 Tax=Haemaphysalis longicornis TaxID=44386 RepID=A0A9J6FFH1_HAELO|nr:hypothetical protein HPB48_002983 [Haemaphysalis longicornis]
MAADVVHFPTATGMPGTASEATVSASVVVSPSDDSGYRPDAAFSTDPRAAFSPAIIPTDGLTGATYRANYDLGFPGPRTRPWHPGPMGPFRPMRYPPRYPDFPSSYIAEKIDAYLRRPCHGPRCHSRRKGFPSYPPWRRPHYPRRGYYFPPPSRRYPFHPPHYFAYEDHEGSGSSHQKTKLSPYHNYGKRYQKRYYAYYYPTGSKYAYVPLPPYND